MALGRAAAGAVDGTPDLEGEVGKHRGTDKQSESWDHITPHACPGHGSQAERPRGQRDDHEHAKELRRRWVLLPRSHRRDQCKLPRVSAERATGTGATRVRGSITWTSSCPPSTGEE